MPASGQRPSASSWSRRSTWAWTASSSSSAWRKPSDTVDKAVAKGIKVVAFDVELGNPGVTQIEQDHHALAQLALTRR